MRKIILITFLLLIACNKPLIKDIKPSEYGTFEFTIVNEKKVPAECVMTFGKYQTRLGIVQPKSEQKIVSIYGDQDNFSVDCVWKEMNTSNCAGTTFELCELSRTIPIGGCITPEVDYQYFCLAQRLNDETFCSKILLEFRRVQCQAYIEKNPDLCDNLDERRDWCYNDIAINTGQAQLCEEIANEVSKSWCSARLNNDVEACLNLNESIDCVAYIAVRTQNISVCDFVDKNACIEQMKRFI